ncbi:predicted protein [Streptomyces sviceus ATCC 29083]|uniref:Uncharacterized protein n=1 Tax=Streptomyces sviceus (strain ATCC 29083 / DSM 924 / JCM 4929 / NBRC 13980 / NCIMB 11184 / NRRL 5439 / UC 5370) TaxID=463191 RepID=B5HXY4_STRX2|nr:predicted protein [Streptomyces sviceus ATCC 29083]
MRLRPPGPRRLSRTDTNTQRATARGARREDRREGPGKGRGDGILVLGGLADAALDQAAR